MGQSGASPVSGQFCSRTANPLSKCGDRLLAPGAKLIATLFNQGRLQTRSHCIGRHALPTG